MKEMPRFSSVLVLSLLAAYIPTVIWLPFLLVDASPQDNTASLFKLILMSPIAFLGGNLSFDIDAAWWSLFLWFLALLVAFSACVSCVRLRKVRITIEVIGLVVIGIYSLMQGIAFLVVLAGLDAI